MRALICSAWGEVDGLTVGDLPEPVPGAGEVLIDVDASAANYADAIMIAGQYQTRPDLPFAPGLEAVGTIRACGAEVTRCAVGDRVMALLHHGGMAERAVAAASDVWRVPVGMSLSDAAAFPIAYLSSDVALRWQGRLTAGETLLVLGAAGGVGLTAVEIGRAMGARVIACASTAEKRAVARAHGADEVLDYTTGDLGAAVMALTGGRGAGGGFDPVGGAVFDAGLSALCWGGRHVLVGSSAVCRKSCQSPAGEEPRRARFQSALHAGTRATSSKSRPRRCSPGMPRVACGHSSPTACLSHAAPKPAA